MNIKKLKKVINQIHKYQLWDEIKDIDEWLQNLTSKEVDNFIKLNVKATLYIKEYKELLITLLDSDYYIEDINLIAYAKTDNIAILLYIVAYNRKLLKNILYSKLMREIADGKISRKEVLV